MSKIKAGTTSGTALVTEGDTTGQLVFQTNGTTTALTLGTDQSATFAGNVSINGSIAVPSPLAITGNSTAGAEIRLPEDTDNGSNYVALKAPNALAANLTLTLPTADGTSGQVLQTNGSGQLSFGTPAGGFSNMVVFTSSGTWTIPAGVTKCKVTVTGAGGGAVGATSGSAGGGAAGTAIKVLTLSGSSATITVGAAGTGTGGASSFVNGSNTITGNGGVGSAATSAPSAGGTASNGDLNITGGDSVGGTSALGTGNFPFAVGGASFWGGGGAGSSNGQGSNGRAYGAGAGGCQAGLFSTGGPGVVVIEY